MLCGATGREENENSMLPKKRIGKRIEIRFPTNQRFFALINIYIIFPLHRLNWAQIELLIQKLAIFRKVKEIKELRGGVLPVHRTSNSVD